MTQREVSRDDDRTFDLEHQREHAEDAGVTELVRRMRGEAVRQVQEILGVETNPNDWRFMQINGSTYGDLWWVVILIDGLKVSLNGNYRLYVDHGSDWVGGMTGARLRTEQDFEEALRMRDAPARAAEKARERFAREVKYTALTGERNPLRQKYFDYGISRCKCIGGPYNGQTFRQEQVRSKLYLELEDQSIGDDKYYHKAIYEQRGRRWMVYLYEFVEFQTSKWQSWG